MADIRVTSTGKTFYQIDSAVAAVLLEAFPASFERVEKPAPPARPANTSQRWCVQRNPFTENWEIVHTTILGESRYPGPNAGIPTVEAARAAFNATGHPVPQEILDQYATKLATSAVVDPDVANEIRLRAQYQQEARDAAAQRKITG